MQVVITEIAIVYNAYEWKTSDIISVILEYILIIKKKWSK